MKSNRTVAKRPFIYHSGGFYKIGVLGNHKNVSKLTFDILNYIGCDTVIIASQNINLAYNGNSSVKKVILVKTCELNEIQKAIDTEKSDNNMIVTIYEMPEKSDINVNLFGNLICICDSYVSQSVCTYDIIMSNMCPVEINKVVHENCSLGKIKLLEFNELCTIVSDIPSNCIMLLNKNGFYKCDINKKIIKFNKFKFELIEVNNIIDIFDKIDKPNKSIVIHGKRRSGKTNLMWEYITRVGNRYDKCMCISANNMHRNYYNMVIDSGCSCITKYDIDEIVNFVKSQGNKLLIFDEFNRADKHMHDLYELLVNNLHLFNLTIVAGLQHITNDKIMKLNHDHFVIFNTQMNSAIKELYNCVGRDYPSCDRFASYVNALGNQYDAMVINNVDNCNYRDNTFFGYIDLICHIERPFKFTHHKLINEKLSILYEDDTEPADLLEYLNAKSNKTVSTKFEDSNTLSESSDEFSSECLDECLDECSDEYSDECSDECSDEHVEDALHDDWADIFVPFCARMLLLGPLNKCQKIFNSYVDNLNKHNDISPIKTHHIFVSPETDSKTIKEYEDAKYCVHYGYNIRDLNDILTAQVVAVANKMENIQHICITTSLVAGCALFLKSDCLVDIMCNGKDYNIYVTVINPTNKLLGLKIRNNFNIVITNHTSDYDIITKVHTNYFGRLLKTQFVDMLDNIYSEDDSELKALVVRRRNDKPVQIIKINLA